jgi:DNA-binding NarL/FixJ family response regulator
MPIVVFSINDDDLAIQSAYGYGANLYIVKPEEYSSLKAVLQKVLTMNWDDPKAITDQYFTRSKYVPFSVA